MKGSNPTITTTAQKIASGSPIANVDKAVHVFVTAAGQTVFFGAAGVTGATNGYPVATGAGFTFFVGPGDDLYAVVAATTQAITVLEMRAA